VTGIEKLLIEFGNITWGPPLLVLLLGGGLFFLVYSRLIPFRHFGHSLRIVLGKYDNPDEPGQISHFQALSTALAGTVGMGNVTSVAVAITTGGPGAIFWMWVSALVGMATKFFTCSLAVMYRGRDSMGNIQGGPMYFITEGLGRKWKPLAIFFSAAGMIGVSPLFQTNQLTQVIRDVILIPKGIPDTLTTNLILGTGIMIVVGSVVLGGIKRIGKVAGSLVPFMVILYIVSVIYILFSNPLQILPRLKLIIRDAFTAESVLGGAVGTIIITGVRRAAFSNEAGIGTAPMAHGAARTREPVREGMVAMMEPLIDTIIVCTMTALAIIVTGVWTHTEADGITLTAEAFNQAIPDFGPYILIACVSVFSLTTLFAFPYYGTKCFGFIFGARYQNIYTYAYTLIIPLGAVGTLGAVISLFDGAYALMAFPTMMAALILSPRVMRAAKDYFNRIKTG